MIHDSITLKSESFSHSCFEEKLFSQNEETNTHHIVHHGIHNEPRHILSLRGHTRNWASVCLYDSTLYTLEGGEREGGGGRGREFVKPREGKTLGFFFLCVTFLFLFSLIQETRVEGGGGASQTACIIFIL